MKQLVELAAAPQTGELEEDVVHILADFLPAGEQPIVGVEAGGAGVVVAGAQMHIVAQFSAFAADHQQHLGVGLVPHDPIDHVGAGLLEPVGQGDIRLLVKPRPQFDHHGHLLAGAGGVDQGIHHGGVRSGAVEGLLDGQHLWIGGGLAQEVDHRYEGLEGVVQQQVAFGDGLEDVSRPGQPRRQARREGGELEVGAVDEVGEGHEAVEIHRPVVHEEVVELEFELRQQEVCDLGGAVVGHLQADLVTVTARRQLPLDGPQQIFHLLLVHEQVRVAGHPELIAPLDLHPGEEVIHMGVDDGGEKHKVVGTAVALPGQPDEPRQGPGRLHNGHAAVAAEGVLPLERDDEVEALVQNARKRVRRIEPQRTEHRGQLILEVVAYPIGLLAVPVAPFDETDLLLLQGREEHLIEHPVLLGHQGVGLAADLSERLGR